MPDIHLRVCTDICLKIDLMGMLHQPRIVPKFFEALSGLEEPCPIHGWQASWYPHALNQCFGRFLPGRWMELQELTSLHIFAEHPL